MNFDRAYITTAGANILAASLGNEYTITWGDVYTSSVDLSNKTDTEIHNITLSDFANTYTSSGHVQNVIVDTTTHTANVYSEITNADYSGVANSFIVLAKLSTDQNYSLVLVAFCGQSTPTTVPGGTEPFVAHINFNVEVSDDSINVVAEQAGWYASNAALQQIANRVVTTHSLNDTTTGENQNILGNKTFKNNLIATAILPETHASNYTAGNDIGNNNNQFRYAYIRCVKAADIESTEITTDEITIDQNFASRASMSEFHGALYCYDNITAEGDIYTQKDILVDGDITVDGNILPKQSNYSNLGSSLMAWNCIYTLDADVKELLTIDSYSNTDSTLAGIQLRSNDQNDLNYILISGHTSTTASSSAYSNLEFRFVTSSTANNHNYFRITTSYTTNGDIVTYPSVNGKWDLGKVDSSNNYKLNRIYANEFIGHASTANGIKYTSSSTGNVIYASSNTTIVPNGNDVKLGDSIHKFDEIHSNKLIGCIPTTELNTQSRPVIQVGGIFLAIVHKNSSGQTPLPVGAEITPYSDNNYDIFVAEYNNASGYWDRYGYGITSTSGARYKLLNALNISSSGNAGNMAHAGDALALMMRIS
jgi:hypothetical protein